MESLGQDTLVVLFALVAVYKFFRVIGAHKRTDTSIDIDIETSDGKLRETHNVPNRGNGKGTGRGEE